MSAYLPKQKSRFCTIELKIRSAKRYLVSLGWKRWTTEDRYTGDDLMPVATPVGRAAFTKAWYGGMTLAKMGAKFRMHPRTVGQKAVSFGPPDRTTWPKKTPPPDA